MLVASLIIILGGFGLGSLYLLSHKGPVAAGTSRIAGHAFYFSSGLLSEDSNQGIDDEFQIDLQNIPIPPPGKSYYGWLLGDRHKNTKENHCQAQQELIFLGTLPVNQGIIHVLYPGDQPIQGDVNQRSGTIRLSVPRFLLRALSGGTGPGQRPSEAPAIVGSRFYDGTAFSLGNASATPAVHTFLYPLDNTPSMDFLLPASGKPGPLKVPDDKLRSLLGITDVNFVRGQQRLAIIDKPLQG